MSDVRDFPPHDWRRLERMMRFMNDVLKEEYEKFYQKSSEGRTSMFLFEALNDAILRSHILDGGGN